MGTSKRGQSSFFDDIKEYDTVDKKKSQAVADLKPGTSSTSPSSSNSESSSNVQGNKDSFFGDIATYDKPSVAAPAVNNTTIPTEATQPGITPTDTTKTAQQKTDEITYKKNPFSYDDFGQHVITQPNGNDLSIDPKTIPINAYKSSDDYIAELQKRVNEGKPSKQDEQVLNINRRNNKNFDAFDDQSLTELASKLDSKQQKILNAPVPDIISNFLPETKGKTFAQAFDNTDGKLALTKELRNKIYDDFNKKYEGAESVPALDKKSQDAVDQLDLLERKLSYEKNKSDVYPPIKEALVSTDESGNLLNKLKNIVLAAIPYTNSIGAENLSEEVKYKVQSLPIDFSIGLNGLKYTDPEQYQRIGNSLAKGEPISESQIAQINAQGIEAREAMNKDAFTNQEINKVQYNKEQDDIKKSRYDNIVNNKEVLRSFLSSGIANIADDNNVSQEKKQAQQANGLTDYSVLTNRLFGHTWNYSDKEIEDYGKAYVQAHGIDPNDARVQDAIKYLQDNEGAMILDNSIAKSGWVRDFAKGLAGPIRGIYGLVEDINKPIAAISAEGQSQGNVNVSEQKLNRIQNSFVESTVSDILEGTGQFVTQAGLAALTSAAIGAPAEALAGSSLGATTAGETIGTGANIGKMLLASKNNLSVFITSYAQAYDQDLKQALTYTSDNDKARVSANIMAGLEGATELWLSPLEIAEGISKKLLNKKEIAHGIVDVLSDAAIVDKNAAIKNFLKVTLKGSLETTRVLAGEIGEEFVTQVADYASNSILNPQSKSFQNRDLVNELGSTAWQTGLSMVVPGLLSGIGAGKMNNFSKGTLVVAAQNRQQLIDDMTKRVHDGDMTQDEMNEKAAIVNTAAKANDLLPVKENGKKLNTDEKADYIYSRVAEGVLNKKLAATDDAAVKIVLEDKIKKEQDFRVKILGTQNNTTDEKTNTTETGTSTESGQSDKSNTGTQSDQSTKATEADQVLAEKKAAIEKNREDELAANKKISELNPGLAGNEETIKQVNEKYDAQLKELEPAVAPIIKTKPKRNATTITPEGQQPENNTESGKQQHAPAIEGQQGEAASETAKPSADGSDKSIGGEQKPTTKKEVVATVKSINSKLLNNADATDEENFNFLKDQSISAPASMNNNLKGNEDLTTDLIASNYKSDIEKAITYQEDRLKDDNLSNTDIEEIDKHIQLLEKGLEKKTKQPRVKVAANVETVNTPAEINPIEKLQQEKEAKIKEVGKPDISLNLLTGKNLAFSKGDPEQNKKRQDKIKSELQELKDLISCLWT